jgi:transketolase
MDKIEFNEKCKKIRRLILEAKFKAKSSHIGSALSAVELLTYLYYDFLNIDFSKQKQDRDFFILSKAHSSSLLYAILLEKKVISKDYFDGMDTNGSFLGDHINSSVPGVEYSLGSLGHGLSVAAGIALSSKMNRYKNKIVVLLGDGECNEGMIWEAASFIPIHNLNNLIAIVDYNKLQGFGRADEFSDMTLFEERWKTFGWRTISINGHNYDEIKSAFAISNELTNKPLLIIANTVKGKGVSFMENKMEWHYYSMNEEQFKNALEGLK